jgi:hypothetical protein
MLKMAADTLASFPDLANAARETWERTQAGLDEAEQFARRGKWRTALKTVEKIPHQSVRLLNIRGCILAGAKRYARAGKLFAAAMEKDAGSRAASTYLRETAKREMSFWER